MAIDPITIGLGLSAISGLFGSKKKESSTAKVDMTTSGQQADLPPELLATLMNLFQNSAGSGGVEQSLGASGDRLAEVAAFDPQAFADAVTGQAAATAGVELDSGINSTLSAAGGGSGSSMAALLESRIRNDAAANLAGISAGARATGEQLKSQGISTATQDINKTIADIIALTRGATVAGSLQEKGTQSTKGTSSAGGGLGGFFAGLASGYGNLYGRVE